MNPEPDLESNSDSEGEIWMKRRSRPSNPSASTSSTQPQLQHVTPLRPSNLALAPFRPNSVRYMSSNPLGVQPPDRPSPPSPLNTRESRWTPIRQPPSASPLLSPIFSDPMSGGPDTRFDSSPPIGGPSSNFMLAPHDATFSMDWSGTTPPRLPLLSEPPGSPIAGSYRDPSAGSCIANRQPTPRAAPWIMDNDYDSDDEAIAPYDRYSDISPLALTSASMEIDDMFRNIDVGGSTIPRTESTDTWVNAARRRSNEIPECEGGDETLVDLPEEDMASGIILNSPVSTSKRERRYTMPTGDKFDAQGDRLAPPSAGPTGRKRELSGGSSKAGHSSHGASEDERVKKRKLKGKGKENVDHGSAMEH